MTKGTSPYRLPVTHAAVSARTGLDAVEAALLDAVDLLGADDTGESGRHGDTLAVNAAGTAACCGAAIEGTVAASAADVGRDAGSLR